MGPPTPVAPRGNNAAPSHDAPLNAADLDSWLGRRCMRLYENMTVFWLSLALDLYEFDFGTLNIIEVRSFVPNASFSIGISIHGDAPNSVKLQMNQMKHRRF